MKNAEIRIFTNLRVIDYCILIKRKNKAELSFVFSLVPLVGVEPTRRISPMDFESIASANFTTAAFI